MTDTGIQQWDVIVVGGGAAGLSAALTLGRSRRSVLVVDAGEPRNARAGGVHNYLGREGVAPGEMTAIGRAEVEAYGGVVRSGRVVSASAASGPEGDPGFVLGLDDRSTHRARRVVIASGVVDELPEVAGLAERWGHDVIHCPYCHGYEVRDRRVGVLASNAFAMHHVGLMRQLTDDVVLFLDDAFAPDPQQREELTARGVEVVAGAVAAVETGPDGDGVAGPGERAPGGSVLRGLRLTDGSVVALDALLVATRVRARAEVAEMLGLAAVEQRMGDVVLGSVLEVDARGATAVPGLWAVGNATDVRAIVISSASAGTQLAAQLNADLVEEDTRRAVAAYRDGGPEFWERFHAGAERVWSGRPNPLLAQVAGTLTPGSALDLGAGEGGDAVWLAGAGWTVTAVDVAENALQKVREHAGPLPVRTERHVLGETFPEGTFDLVSAQYLHSMDDDFPRTAILRRAADAVAPGGTLLVVGHGALAPWSWDPTLRMATAPEVLAALELGGPGDEARWEVVRCDSPERTATGPDGQEATITDEVVQVRRVPVPAS